MVTNGAIFSAWSEASTMNEGIKMIEVLALLILAPSMVESVVTWAWGFSGRVFGLIGRG